MRLGQRLSLSVLLLTTITILLGASVSAVELTFPVPVKTIYPGELLDDTVITERRFSRSFRGQLAMIDTREAIIGKVARRTLLPGRPIPAAAVAEPELVKRGAPVRMVFQDGGVLIVAQATSLQSGSAGDLIRVRNVDSGLILAGTIHADGTVRVGNP